MKRKLFLTILLLKIITVLGTVRPAYTAPYPYKIFMITNNSYDDGYHQINDNGYVVWSSYTGNAENIFLYDGMSTIQLTNNYHVYDQFPDINDNGQVVWSRHDGSSSQIFLYDGINIIQLSDDSYWNVNPQINNNGYVVWNGYNDSDNKIFLYDGTRTIQLTGNYSENQYPQISNNGNVVWAGYESHRDIFLYDGTNTLQLSDTSYQNWYPKMNNSGQVVWMGVKPGLQNFQIFLYDGTNTLQLSDGSYNDLDPQINNDGKVVWRRHFGADSDSPSGIMFYDGTSSMQLTNDFDYNWGPQINDRGYVVWYGAETWYDSNSEIFLYDGVGITQITDNSYLDGGPLINNRDEIVWGGVFPHSDMEIFIARPIQVELLFPNGSEKIPSGSIYTIQWKAPVAVATFNIFYSLNNGASWNKISEKVTGSSYDWIVPANNKKNCLVKIVAYNEDGVELSDDVSDSTFKIEVVNVTSPNGGESWKSRDGGYPITWVTGGTIRPVATTKLYYTMNGGTTWNLIATLSGNPGSYTWYIPQVNVKKEKCKVKVVLKDAAGRTVGSDKSDRNFTITP
jgi:hypothetical protein